LSESTPPVPTRIPRALSVALTAVVLLGAAVAIRVEGPSTSAEDTGPSPFPAPGSTVPDFALPVLGTEAPYLGEDTLRLSDLAGRYVYLDVFGSWCLPCQQKYPHMFDIADELNEIGAVIVGLLLEDSPEDAARYFGSHGGQAYPFLMLDDETVRTWGITGAPMGFLVSPEGTLERLCFGCQSGGSRVETLPEAVRAGLTERYRNSS
jgi:thiol-disulfide isomerase/thioredoxin